MQPTEIYHVNEIRSNNKKCICYDKVITIDELVKFITFFRDFAKALH